MREDPPIGFGAWAVMIVVVAGLAFIEARCNCDFPVSKDIVFGPEDAQP